MAATRLEKLLKSGASSPLDRIVRKARDLGDLTGALQAALGPELAQAVRAASVRDDTLVIISASSAWASRLRFEDQAILKAAGDAGVTASRLRVQVARDSD